MQYKQVIFFLISATLILYGNIANAQVTGRVIDQRDQTPIEYSSVAVFSARDSSLLSGTITDAKGYFELKGLTNGNYYLSIQFVGYETRTVSRIQIDQSHSKIDLGDIPLTMSVEVLGEVTVQGAPRDVNHTIDKQIYHADQFQSATGGSAVDVLRNMPSVSVNVDGKIMMRGSTGFLVLLDGRPVTGDVTAFLSQLPANVIADIEIVTAPSARYDPDGKSGIINIRTKKGTTDGVYLLVNAQLGAPSIETYGNEKIARRFGGDITTNIKLGKWDVSVGMDYKRNDNTGYRNGEISTFLNGIHTASPSLGERSYQRESYSGRAAASYVINESNTLSASIFGGKRSEWRTADLLYTQTRTLDGENAPYETSTYFNKNLRERRGDFFIASMDYQHIFKNASSLTASFLYERTELGGPTDNLNVNPLDHSDILEHQIMEEYNPLDGFRASLTHVLPITKETNLESGYQYRHLIHIGEFAYDEAILGTPDFVTRPEFGGDIDLTRKIHSFFSQYNKTGEKLDYAIGLRLEHTDRVLEEVSGTKYLLNRWDVFPSANILYKAPNGYQWKGAYSRRIERTTTSMMNPFMARRHAEVLEEGDPELLPELIDAVELGLIKNFDKNSVFANLYYRHTANAINRVNSIYNDVILYRTYTNTRASLAYGVEAGLEFTPIKWWKLYTGGTLYRYSINGKVFDQELQGSSLNYSFNVNTTFKINSTWNTQFNLNYLSRTATVQGEDSQIFSPNLSVRKSVFKNRGAFTLQWSNISMGLLDSNRQRMTTAGVDFYSSTNYISEVDRVSLNFTYRINELSKALKFSKSEFGDKEF